MLDAPVMTEAEQEEYIARVPEAQRWAVRGWLKGTHDLDGTPRVPVAVGQ
jgi:hypothetical protein